MAEMPPENPNRPREYHGGHTLLAGIGVVVVIALVLWAALLRGGDEATADGIVELPAALNPDGRDVAPRILAMAPDFELEMLDGERLRLSDLRGRPVVINFWASWCSPCRREIPALIRAQRESADSGLVVIGVNIEEPRSAAQAFVDDFGVDFAIPMDFDGSVFRAYGEGGLVGPPRTFFVDSEGLIRLIYAGQAPDDLIARDVAEHALQAAR